ncbi:unnamed protein product, partial [Nesidiocoris tenuis]
MIHSMHNDPIRFLIRKTYKRPVPKSWTAMGIGLVMHKGKAISYNVIAHQYASQDSIAEPSKQQLK